jgi:hypothetical protein
MRNFFLDLCILFLVNDFLKKVEDIKLKKYYKLNVFFNTKFFLFFLLSKNKSFCFSFKIFTLSIKNYLLLHLLKFY